MLAPWFERKRAAALAVAYNGASIGGVVFAPLWVSLISRFGFVAAAAIIGIAMVVTLWWLAGRFLRPTPAGLGLVPDGDALPAGSATEAPAHFRVPLPHGVAAWRDLRFATLSVAFAFGFFAQIGLVVNLVLLTAPLLGEGGAGAAVSLVTACAVAGRSLAAMVLQGGIDWRNAARANFALQAAGTLALLVADGHSVPLLLLGCVLFGLGVGNLISFLPLIAAAEFAPPDVGRAVALATSVNQATYAFAPVILGLLRDLTAGSDAQLVAIGLAQAIAIAVLRR
jgi:hypothetical protein